MCPSLVPKNARERLLGVRPLLCGNRFETDSDSMGSCTLQGHSCRGCMAAHREGALQHQAAADQ